MRWQRSLLLALFILAGTAGLVSAQDAASQQGVLEKGREYTTWFLAGEAGKLWPLFSQEMKEALGSEEALQGFQVQVEGQMGNEQKVLDEQVQMANGFRVYTRTAQFSNYPGPIEVVWALDAKDGIAGFFIRPKQD
jgi:hypothetical protein